MRKSSAPTLGQRLREARLLAGYRRARHFAEALGIKENTYCRYERNEVMPSYDCLARISQLLKLDVSDLVAAASQGASNSEPFRSPADPDIDSAQKAASDSGTPPHSNSHSSLTDSNKAPTAIPAPRAPADPINLTTICSLHAWRLSQLLAARTGEIRGTASSQLALVTEYYFCLKKDPYPTLAPFLDERGAHNSTEDAELRAAIGRFLEAYHNHINSLFDSG